MTLSGMLLLDVYEVEAESKHVILVRMTHLQTHKEPQRSEKGWITTTKRTVKVKCV